MGTGRLKILEFVNGGVGVQSCCRVAEPSPALGHTLRGGVRDGGVAEKGEELFFFLWLITETAGSEFYHRHTF